MELPDAIQAKLFISLGLNLKFLGFSNSAKKWISGNSVPGGLVPSNGRGGSRRLFAFLDPYSYFIKLTPFTTPTFEIFYLVWSEDFGWVSARLGG